MKHPSLDISSGAYLAAACGILLLPLNWLLSAMLAALVHECGHLAALRCCGVQVFEIKVGAFGARITTEPMSPLQELVCAAAGPVCSLLLILFADTVAILAMIGFFHGIFNLLPVFPMDGGRILKALVEIIRQKVAR